MQLLQEFEMFAWALPPKWQIVATANPEGGDYSVTPMDDAMITRLLHITMVDRLSPGTVRSVLEGYRNRYGKIRDAVCETEPSLRNDLLADQSVTDLLVEPVGVIADRLRSETGRRQ